MYAIYVIIGIVILCYYGNRGFDGSNDEIIKEKEI